MQSVAVFLALVAVASAGNLGAVYSAGPIGYAAGPVGYAAPVAYAQPAVATYAAAPVVAKAVVPAAHSTAYINRAPAARVAVAAAPVAYAQPAVATYAAGPVAYGGAYGLAGPAYLH